MVKWNLCRQAVCAQRFALIAKSGPDNQIACAGRGSIPQAICFPTPNLKMAETLGSLCDKLTIVRLKQWHSTDGNRLASLARQQAALQAEIDDFVAGAISRRIPDAQLKFAANKVYREKAHALGKITGEIGAVVAKLAEANCALWHQQEMIYDFEKVPAAKKNGVIKKLAILNLERNRCIEVIDGIFRDKIAATHGPAARSGTKRAAKSR